MMNQRPNQAEVAGSNPDPASPDHAPVKSTTDARAGVTFGTMRWVLALLVLTPYGVAAYWATIYPPLRDISTDFDDPPALDVSDRTKDMNVLSPPTPGEQRL